MGYLDTLVPADANPRDLLERLDALGVTDDGHRVQLGSADSATFNLVRLALAADRDVSMHLPRGLHDVSVMLGVYLQLMRRTARVIGRPRDWFDGPIVIIALNRNLTGRLRRIRIDGKPLSEALAARRVRGDGQVTDLRGNIGPATDYLDGLLYLNTSLGWPSLGQVRPGVVVIDRTSFRNPRTLDDAFAWAHAHHSARTVLLGDIGDIGSTPSPATWPRKDGQGEGGQAGSPSDEWVRWSWAPDLRTDLTYELGSASPCGPLSTNALTSLAPAPIGVALYQAPALSRLRRRALAGIMAARRVGAPLPRQVADAVTLVNHLTRLWGDVRTANQWAVADPRGTSAATLARNLRGARPGDLPRLWHTFAESRWAEFRHDVISLSDLLTEHNPRLDLLLSLLDWAHAERPGAQVTVRAASQATAFALIEDLGSRRPDLVDVLTAADQDTAAVRVVAYSKRLRWAEQPSLELHLGVPAPWRRSALISAEASEQIVVLDPDERPWLDRLTSNLAADCAIDAHLTCATLHLGALPVSSWEPPRTVYGPLAIDDRGTDVDAAMPPAPGLDLAGLLAAFDDVVTEIRIAPAIDDPAAPVRLVPARAAVVAPGDQQYWLPADARAEVLAGDRYAAVAVADLTAGVSLLISRGEGREGIYLRLQQVIHAEADVMALSMMLGRFRRAVRALHDEYGTWDAVKDTLAGRGSRITTGQTCRLWATGEVIAPDDIGDIRRVGLAVGEDALTLDGNWQRLGLIADELRKLHRHLGKLLSAAISEAASGQPGPNLARLSHLCGGIDTAEVLEGFEVRRVLSVGPTSLVPSNLLRRLQPHPTLTNRDARRSTT
ncbi:hypothetical protein [Nocardioides speluncae]|uniref:DISARM anti-phage system protein DrmE domain-containing protein n=1 Tax=Nocardioides speluncae TaxID=2670337 RepID=UPI000D69D423|nr:hypothetical protein [Nocardioides speluncae]